MEANMLLPMTLFAKYVTTQEIVFEPDVTVVRAKMEDDILKQLQKLDFRLRQSTVIGRF